MADAKRSERGEGRMGTLFGLFVLALLVYAGFKVIPVMINTYAFRDYLEEEARFAALRNKDEEIRRSVLRKAQDLDLPVKAGDIKIVRSSSHFDISVSYSVPIQTPVYTYNWTVSEQSRAPLF